MKETDIFKIIKSHFEIYDVIELQKTSFEDFLHNQLPKIIDNVPNIIINTPDENKYRVIISNIDINKPYVIEEDRSIRYITPIEARTRDLTYSGVVTIDIKTELSNKIF